MSELKQLAMLSDTVLQMADYNERVESMKLVVLQDIAVQLKKLVALQTKEKSK